MQQLLDQLGINWQLLLSQGVNFILLLIVLRIFVYKPLLKLLHDRREKIENGLMKAQEAEERLLEVDQIGIRKIKEAEAEAFSILKKIDTDAKVLEAKLLAEAHRKEDEAVKNTATRLRSQEENSRREMEKEAAALVRLAITKTVELSPEKIDDALISKAVSTITGTKQTNQTA
jgi:F-type H+-transporting ATPase subunit b